MSHFTKVRTKLVDESVLRKTLAAMGYEVLPVGEGVKGFVGGRAQADFKIQPGRREYEIGFVRERGAYTIVADWWGIKSVNEASFAAAVSQQYAVQGTLQTLEDKGYALTEQAQDETGTIRLVLRRGM